MSTLNKRFTATLQKRPSKGGWTSRARESTQGSGSAEVTGVTARDELNSSHLAPPCTTRRVSLTIEFPRSPMPRIERRCNHVH